MNQIDLSPVPSEQKVWRGLPRRLCCCRGCQDRSSIWTAGFWTIVNPKLARRRTSPILQMLQQKPDPEITPEFTGQHLARRGILLLCCIIAWQVSCARMAGLQLLQHPACTVLHVGRSFIFLCAAVESWHLRMIRHEQPTAEPEHGLLVYPRTREERGSLQC